MRNCVITIDDLEDAQKQYAEREPRALFYRAATTLVENAINGKPPLTTAEALGVLLQTWNKAYYRFRTFDNQHLGDLEHVISENQAFLRSLRNRRIEEFASNDEEMVTKLFDDFERVLGPVGAAKSLHLLAPSFFPIWDRSIAQAYGLRLRSAGNNGPRYCEFMTITRGQVNAVGGEQRLGRNALKAIDEFNYCKFSLKRVESA